MYKSVMVIVTPCRSDLSTKGLSPLSHLADGRLTLALVKSCSILSYLRFLAAIPKTGVLLTWSVVAAARAVAPHAAGLFLLGRSCCCDHLVPPAGTALNGPLL